MLISAGARYRLDRLLGLGRVESDTRQVEPVT